MFLCNEKMRKCLSFVKRGNAEKEAEKMTKICLKFLSNSNWKTKNEWMNDGTTIKSNFAKWWWNKKAVLCSFEKKVKEEYHSILQRGKSAGQKQILLLRNLAETVYTGADIVNKL